MAVAVAVFSKKEKRGDEKTKMDPRYDRYDFGAAAAAVSADADSTLGPAAAARRSFTR